MTSTGPDDRARLVGELAELATDLATGAADLVRAHADTAHTVAAKSTATDLVTDVDRLTERWLRDRLHQLRPHDAVLGEEGADDPGDVVGGVVGDTAVRWVLDPIDGTVNFVLGLPQYAVSVAAELDGRVVAGAVCNPMSRELFHARLGGGAYLGDRALRGPRAVPVERMVVGTGFGYDATRRERQAAVVARLLPRIADIRRLGAASLDLCAVAAGRLDGYFEIGLQRWDYAAGLLIATEAGCAAFGPAGAPPDTALVGVSGRDTAADFERLLVECGIAEVLG